MTDTDMQVLLEEAFKAGQFEAGARIAELEGALKDLVNLDQRCGWCSKEQDKAMALLGMEQPECSICQRGAHPHNDRSVDAENAWLRSALKALLDRHVDLVSSGDCGFWDVEEEREVIDARAALQQKGQEND